jgi:hypothetical protein
VKASLAQAYVQCRRPGARNDPLVEKAVRFAETQPELQGKLREQGVFDAQVMAAILAIQPPGDLKQRLAARAAEPSAKPRGRPQFTVPIILTMACGVLSIIGLLVVMEMDHLDHFPGREETEKMIDIANGMSGVELDQVGSAAGQLGDWFFLHGFDGYAAPEEFAALPAVGSRVLHLDGKPVAQVAIDRHDCILYVFRASDFGLDVSEKKDWIVFDHEGWAAAVRRRDDACSMVIFRGSKSEMEKFIRSLHQT